MHDNIEVIVTGWHNWKAKITKIDSILTERSVLNRSSRSATIQHINRPRRVCCYSHLWSMNRACRGSWSFRGASLRGCWSAGGGWMDRDVGFRDGYPVSGHAALERTEERRPDEVVASFTERKRTPYWMTQRRVHFSTLRNIILFVKNIFYNGNFDRWSVEVGFFRWFFIYVLEGVYVFYWFFLIDTLFFWTYQGSNTKRTMIRKKKYNEV